jgi:hypothetical protein
VQDEVSGKTYWLNRENGNSMWQKPEELDAGGAVGGDDDAVAVEGHDDVARNKIFARRARRMSKQQLPS